MYDFYASVSILFHGADGFSVVRVTDGRIQVQPLFFHFFSENAVKSVSA